MPRRDAMLASHPHDDAKLASPMMTQSLRLDKQKRKYCIIGIAEKRDASIASLREKNANIALGSASF